MMESAPTLLHTVGLVLLGIELVGLAYVLVFDPFRMSGVFGR